MFRVSKLRKRSLFLEEMTVCPFRIRQLSFICHRSANQKVFVVVCMRAPL